MDTLPLFSFEEPEPKTQPVPMPVPLERTEGSDGDVPEEYLVGHHAAIVAAIVEEQAPDGTRTPVDLEQGSAGPDGVNAGTGAPAPARDAHPVYESTGLPGPFALGPLALVFPDSPEEGLNALAVDIAANGLLEEITVAGYPPSILDGKRRLRACERAGRQPVYRLLRRDIDPRNYLWAKNGERRDLTKSQKALAAAELSSFSGPGRPRNEGENSAVLQNSPRTTMDQVAGQGGFSTRLLNDAARIADRDGHAVPELREAVREGMTTITDVAQSRVISAPPDVQRQAVALVRADEARTVAAAVARVLAHAAEQDSPTTFSPTRSGEIATFHHCSVADLGQRMAPGTVDLIVALPPADARLATFSDLAALATRALTQEGVMVVAVADTGRLPGMLARLRRHGPEWIMEFSLLFPTPVAASGDPNWIALRRVALLVCGKPGARLRGEGDIIDLSAPSAGTGDRPPELKDGMAQVVRHFASSGQVVCDPMVGGRSAVASAAIGGGCTFIGADDDQSRIDRVVEQLAGTVSNSPPQHQEGPGGS